MTFNSVCDWGRFVTPDEFATCQAKIDEMAAAGVVIGTKTVNYRTVTRVWLTEEAANTWVTFVLTNFTPAPVSAVVEIV